MPILVLAIDPIVVSRNYSADNSKYVSAMMQEINWEKVSDRLERAEKLLK